MIMTDEIGHLASDRSLRELHDFAKAIGLKRRWFQDGTHPHYDLTTIKKRAEAVSGGACLVSSRKLVRCMVKGEEYRAWKQDYGQALDAREGE